MIKKKDIVDFIILQSCLHSLIKYRIHKEKLKSLNYSKSILMIGLKLKPTSLLLNKKAIVPKSIEIIINLVPFNPIKYGIILKINYSFNYLKNINSNGNK
jgi:hypothetical protein